MVFDGIRYIFNVNKYELNLKFMNSYLKMLFSAYPSTQKYRRIKKMVVRCLDDAAKVEKKISFLEEKLKDALQTEQALKKSKSKYSDLKESFEELQFINNLSSSFK